MSRPSSVEPLLVVHVAGAHLGLPISCVDRLASDQQGPLLDLGELCELVGTPQKRAARIAIYSGAGTMAVGIDGVGEVLRRYTLEPLSPLCRLSQPHRVCGLARSAQSTPSWVIVLDGVAIGDLIAGRVFEGRS